MKCHLCSWDLDNNGCCTNYVSYCRYKGRGLAIVEIAEQAKGHQLGDTTGPANKNNGSGYVYPDEDSWS